MSAPDSPALAGQLALVIGATGGIGSAIAAALAGCGAALTCLGRDTSKLAALQAQLPTGSTRLWPCDFLNPNDVAQRSRELAEPGNDFDIVVVASGEYAPGSLRQAGVEAFDRAYAINLRAPYALLRASLDGLIRRSGQVVVVSSSAALRGRGGAAQYSATHAALRSLVESLHDDVNPFEVRVLAVYPGRTATGIWSRDAEKTGQPYRPELLLQPQDIAVSIVSALTLPRSAEVTDLHIRPLRKSY